MPNREGYRSTTALEPDRLRVILQRLQDKFYDETSVADRIAARVLADIRDFDESSAALPH